MDINCTSAEWVDILLSVPPEIADRILRNVLGIFKPTKFLAECCTVSHAWKSRIEASGVWGIIGRRYGFVIPRVSGSEEREQVTNMDKLKSRFWRLKHLNKEILMRVKPIAAYEFFHACFDNGIMAATHPMHGDKVVIINPCSGTVLRDLPCGTPLNHEIAQLQMKENHLLVYSEAQILHNADQEKAQRFAIIEITDGKMIFEAWGNIANENLEYEPNISDFNIKHDMVVLFNNQIGYDVNNTYIRIYKISNGQQIAEFPSESPELDDAQLNAGLDEPYISAHGPKLRLEFGPECDSEIFYVVWYKLRYIHIVKLTTQDKPWPAPVVGVTRTSIDGYSPCSIPCDFEVNNGIIHVYNVSNYCEDYGSFDCDDGLAPPSTGLKDCREEQVDIIRGEMYFLNFSQSRRCFKGTISPFLPSTFSMFTRHLSLNGNCSLKILGVGKRFLIFRHHGQYEEYPSKTAIEGGVLEYNTYGSCKDVFRVVRIPDRKEVIEHKKLGIPLKTHICTLRLPVNGGFSAVRLLDQAWLDGIDGETDSGPLMIRIDKFGLKRAEVYAWK